jgi:hypothetical protein
MDGTLPGVCRHGRADREGKTPVARGTLKSDYTLKHAALPVPRTERIGPELAARMPGGQKFRIVVEGTEEFTQYIEELQNDTIWAKDKE